MYKMVLECTRLLENVQDFGECMRVPEKVQEWGGLYENAGECSGVLQSL